MTKYIVFNIRGILKEKLKINTFNIYAYSAMLHLIFTMVLTFLSVLNCDDIKPYHIIIPLWGLLSYGLFTNENINEKFHIIIILPLIFWINLITGIFILIYRKNYPNVSVQNVDRYMKLKKLMK